MSQDGELLEIFHLVIDQNARFVPAPLADPQPFLILGSDCRAVIEERGITGAYVLANSCGQGHDIFEDPRLLTEALTSSLLWLRRADLHKLIDWLGECYADGSPGDARLHWGERPDFDGLTTLLRQYAREGRYLADDAVLWAPNLEALVADLTKVKPPVTGFDAKRTWDNPGDYPPPSVFTPAAAKMITEAWARPPLSRWADSSDYPVPPGWGIVRIEDIRREQIARDMADPIAQRNSTIGFYGALPIPASTAPLKIFVATQSGQGRRENDFSLVAEGEILTFGAYECTGEPADGPCGCARSLCGIECLMGTTTMQVQTFNGNLSAFIDIQRKALDKGGFTEQNGEPWAERAALYNAQRIVKAASQFPVGTVVERRGGDHFQVRLEQAPKSWGPGSLQEVRNQFLEITGLDLDDIGNALTVRLLELLPAALVYLHATFDIRDAYNNEDEE